MRNAAIALYETFMQLQSQRLKRHQANQLTDQTRREKSWLCDDLEMRKELFKKIVQEIAKNSGDIAAQKWKEFDS